MLSDLWRIHETTFYELQTQTSQCSFLIPIEGGGDCFRECTLNFLPNPPVLVCQVEVALYQTEEPCQQLEGGYKVGRESRFGDQVRQ